MGYYKFVVYISLVLVCLDSCFMVQGYPSEGSTAAINQVEFRNVSRFTYTSSYVRHMEADKSISGNILFVDAHRLATSDGGSVSVIAGKANSGGFKNSIGENASFNIPSGFHQVNASHVIISDYNNHCLRLVNRLTRAVSTFSGQCRNAGNNNGNSTYAKFYYPWSIILDKTNHRQLIVSQASSSYMYLRSVDISTGAVGILVSSGLYSPRGMTWDKSENYLYVTNAHYIAKIDWATKETTTLVGSTSSHPYNVGKFDRARFRSPIQMIYLHKDTYALVESGRSQVKAVNMISKQVFYFNLPGGVYSSYSIAKINGSLFLGNRGSIQKLTDVDCRYLETVFIRPGAINASVTIDSCGNTAVLPVGEYQFDIPSANSSGYQLHIKESLISRRLVLEAEYTISCSSLLGNPLAKVLLDPVLKHKMADLQDICRSDCNMSTIIEPTYTCSGNALKVKWPTDVTYEEIITEVPANIRNLLKERLSEAGHKKAEIFTYDQKFKFIQAKIGSTGTRTYVALNSTCTVPGKFYEAHTDKCV